MREEGEGGKEVGNNCVSGTVGDFPQILRQEQDFTGALALRGAEPWLITDIALIGF